MMEQVCYRLTFASLIVLCLGLFTSITLSSLSHILLFIPAVYFFLTRAKEVDFKRVNLSVYFMDLICLGLVLSVFANWEEMDKPEEHLFKVKYFLLALLSIFAYRETLTHYLDTKKISLLLNLLLAVTSLATLSGLVGLFAGINPLKMESPCHPTRACGLFGMYMTYGYGLGLFMVLLTGALLYRKELERYVSVKVLWAAWIINSLGLYFSYTRGAWLSVLVGVPFFFFKRRRRAFLSGLGLGLVALGLAFGFSPSVRKMFLERGESDAQRVAFFQAALRAFSERPVFGLGHRNFEPQVPEIKRRYAIAYPEMGGHAHNNFLEFLASMGIVGFMALFLWHLYWALESLGGRNLLGRLSFPFVVALTVGGLTQYTLGDGENLFLILNLWALGQVNHLK